MEKKPAFSFKEFCIHKLELTKQKLAGILILSFTFSFMVFFYSPFDIYLHNSNAFVVGWKFLLPPLFALMLTGFAVMSITLLLLTYKNAILGVFLILAAGVLIVIARYVFNMLTVASTYLLIAVIIAAVLWFFAVKYFKKYTFDFIILILWGITIAFYVQVLLLNGDMVMITGGQAGYDLLSPKHIGFLSVFMLITLMPFGLWLLYLLVRKKKLQYEKIIIISSLIIIGMQLSGLVLTAASANLPKGYEDEDNRYISNAGTLSLNKDENIIVLLLDRIDVLYIRDALDQLPHIRDYLDGFVFYENNMAEFYDTLPSVTSMLTQHYYEEGTTIHEYWDMAWGQYTVIDRLKDDGFTINLYLDYMSTYGNLDHIAGRADNINDHRGIVVNYRGFADSIIRLSLGRLSPYMVKNRILAYVTPDFGNTLFNVVNPDPSSVRLPVAGRDADNQFLEYITQNEMKADNRNKVFMFMHLNGAHGEDHIEPIYASMEILNAYFGKMKEIDVFDSSTIILIGDHGNRRHYPETVSLLIKEKNSTGDLIIDSETELSNRYFAASLLEIAGIPHGDLGLSYFDLLAGESPPVRRLNNLSGWMYSWIDHGTEGMMELYGVYKVSGDANNDENWHYTPS